MSTTIFSSLLPIITLLLGFGLGWLKEYIQNRPIIKIDLGGLESKFDFCNFSNNEIGETIRNTNCEIKDATLISFKLKLIFYNLGNGDSAIKDILLSIENKSSKLYFSHLEKDIINSKIRIFRLNDKQLYFNLPAKSICPIDFYTQIHRVDSNEFIFDNDILNLDSNFKIHIIAKTIDGKNLTLVINPISILPSR